MSLRVLAGRLLRHPTMTLCHGGPIECNYFQNKKVLQSKLLQPDIISRFEGFQKFKCRRRTASKPSYGQRHISATEVKIIHIFNYSNSVWQSLVFENRH